MGGRSMNRHTAQTIVEAVDALLAWDAAADIDAAAHAAAAPALDKATAAAPAHVRAILHRSRGTMAAARRRLVEAGIVEAAIATDPTLTSKEAKSMLARCAIQRRHAAAAWTDAAGRACLQAERAIDALV